MKKLCLTLLFSLFLVSNTWAISPAFLQMIGSGGSAYKNDLLAYWDFDAAANPFNDLHNSNDLTNSGADDVAGGHRWISGNSDYADRDGAFIDEDGIISVMIRFKWIGNQGWTRVIVFYDNDNGVQFIFNNDDLMVVPGKGSAGDWGGVGNESILIETLVVDTWYVVVAVFSNTQPKTVLRCYMNNAQETTTDNGGLATPGTDNDKYVVGARCCYSNYADVLISNMAIWQRELTAQEAQDISNTNYEYSGW